MLERLIQLLEAAQAFHKKRYGSIAEMDEHTLDIVGVSDDTWRRASPGTRWSLVTSRIIELSGLTGRVDAAVEREFILTLQDATQIRKQVDEFVELVGTQGVTPFTPPVPKPLKVGSFGEAGEAWLKTVNNAQVFRGREMYTALVQEAGLSAATIGRLVGGVYAGGFESTVARLVARGVELDLAERVVRSMQSERINDGLHGFFMEQTEDFNANFMFEVFQSEYVARIAVFNSKLPEEGVPLPDDARAALNAQERLVNIMWMFDDVDDEPLQLTELEAINSILDSPMGATWYDALMRDPALFDSYASVESDVSALSPDEIESLFGHYFAQAGYNLENPETIPQGLAQFYRDVNRIVTFHKRVERGEISPEFLKAQRDVDEVTRGNGLIWDVYDASMNPVVQNEGLSLMKIAQVRDVYLDRIRNANTGATPDLLAQLLVDASREFDTQTGGASFNESIENMLRGTGLNGLTDATVIHDMKEKGMVGILEAMNYVTTNRRSKVSKLEFKDLLADYLDAQVRLGGLTDNVLDVVQTSADSLWFRFLFESGRERSSVGIHLTQDAEEWVHSTVDGYMADSRAFIADPKNNPDPGPLIDLFKDKVDALQDKVDASGLAVEKAKSRTLSAGGRVMWELGVAVLEAEAAAGVIFTPAPGETADQYFDRLDETMRTVAHDRDLLDPDFVDTLGALQADTDIRAVLESRGDFIPQEVYVAENFGVTIDRVRELQRELVRKSVPSPNPAHPITQALVKPESQVFLESITPLVEQLPIAQQTDAFTAAIQAQEALQAEFQAQLPTDEEGEPLSGRALREAREEAEERRVLSFEAAISRALEREFGLTSEQVQAAITQSQVERGQAEFATTIQRLEQAVADEPDPDRRIALAERLEEARLKEAAREALGPEAPPGEPPPPPAVGIGTGALVGVGVDVSAVEARAAEFRQRGAAAQRTDVAFTFEEFLRRQSPTRFRATSDAQTIIPPQLRTRRVS